jgi:hypothetical protein
MQLATSTAAELQKKCVGDSVQHSVALGTCTAYLIAVLKCSRRVALAQLLRLPLRAEALGRNLGNPQVVQPLRQQVSK